MTVYLVHGIWALGVFWTYPKQSSLCTFGVFKDHIHKNCPKIINNQKKVKGDFSPPGRPQDSLYTPTPWFAAPNWCWEPLIDFQKHFEFPSFGVFKAQFRGKIGPKWIKIRIKAGVISHRQEGSKTLYTPMIFCLKLMLGFFNKLSEG